MKNFTTIGETLIKAREHNGTWDYVSDLFTLNYWGGFNTPPAFVRDVRTGKLMAVKREDPKNKLGKVADYLETLRDEKAPCPGIFVLYSLYDEYGNDCSYDALLFKAEDIYNLKDIPSWNRLTGYYCSDDDGKTSVHTFDSNHVLVELTQISNLPQPIRYGKDDLVALMNAWVVDYCPEFPLACFLNDAASFVCEKHIKCKWLPEDYTGGIPFPYVDEDDYVMNDDYCERDIRKSILCSYVNLYHALVDVREKLFEELHAED